MGSILAILGLGLMIFLHELGHLLMARYTGIPVSRFSIGMGPVIFSRQAWGLEWAISAVPFGGYVMFDGDDEGYEKSPASAQILTALAGPLANFIVGFSLYVLAASLAAGSPAILEGLTKGMTAMNQMFHVLGMLFTGQVGIKDLGGPVMMVSQGASLSHDPSAFLRYVGFLSLNLGIFNLLPIPALDGGRILLTLFTALSGRKPSENFQAVVIGGSFFLIMGLIAWVTIQDVVRLL
jgi:regulator of sigma E protease